MADMSWEHAAEARAALNAIVTDPEHGVAALSSAQTMSNLLKDLLPDAPREKSMLVAAAEAGLAGSLREHVAQGMDPNTAIRLTASSFSATTPFTPEACSWVAGEIAIALGISTPAEAGPPQSGPPGSDQIGGTPPGFDQIGQQGLGYMPGPAQGYPQAPGHAQAPGPGYPDLPTQGYPQVSGQGGGYSGGAPGGAGGGYSGGGPGEAGAGFAGGGQAGGGYAGGGVSGGQAGGGYPAGQAGGGYPGGQAGGGYPGGQAGGGYAGGGQPAGGYAGGGQAGGGYAGGGQAGGGYAGSGQAGGGYAGSGQAGGYAGSGQAGGYAGSGQAGGYAGGGQAGGGYPAGGQAGGGGFGGGGTGGAAGSQPTMPGPWQGGGAYGPGGAPGGYGIVGAVPGRQRRGRRGYLITGGLVMVVIVVIVVFALMGSSPSPVSTPTPTPSPTPSPSFSPTPPVGRLESLNQIINPPGQAPIGTRCALAGLAKLAASTVKARLKCDTSVSRLYVWAYQFRNAADYQRGFTHLQNYLVFRPSSAGGNCPPRGSRVSGATNWRSDNPKYHSYTGQFLDCLTIHGTYGNEVTYLWTLPSQHVVFLAQSWNTHLTFHTMDTWWAHLSYG